MFDVFKCRREGRLLPRHVMWSTKVRGDLYVTEQRDEELFRTVRVATIRDPRNAVLLGPFARRGVHQREAGLVDCDRLGASDIFGTCRCTCVPAELGLDPRREGMRRVRPFSSLGVPALLVAWATRMQVQVPAEVLNADVRPEIIDSTIGVPGCAASGRERMRDSIDAFVALSARTRSVSGKRRPRPTKIGVRRTAGTPNMQA